MSEAQLRDVFFAWWNKAGEKGLLDRQAESYEHWQMDFLVRFSARKTPLGSSTIAEAMRRACDATDNPQCASRFTEESNRKLLRLLMHLQDMAGDSPFSLSVRDAATFIEVNKETASNRLRAFRAMGFLELVTKGIFSKDRESGKRMASEYRFKDRK